MLSRMHKKLGTAGLVVSIVALIAALAGGAYAAAGFTKAQEKQIAKIAKKSVKAKRGPAGPAGPQGPAGTNGTNGKDGTNGTNGKDGAPGAAGKNGNSVVVASEAAGANCANAGVKVTVENTPGTKYVCNGKDGETGFTDTLPPGKTETGTWTTGTVPTAESSVLLSFSFNIPLAEGSSYNINWINGAGEAKVGAAANCDGEPTAPEADPGNLCIYTLGEENTSGAVPLTPVFADEAGAIAIFNLKAGGSAVGTWAVTAPTA